MKESELYAPLKGKFEKLGYSVRGEVKNCDLVAEKDGRFVAVEMKTSFNLKLVYQALERRKLAEEVYNYERIRHCPHGRPVMFVLTKYELEKQFRRV